VNNKRVPFLPFERNLGGRYSTKCESLKTGSNNNITETNKTLNFNNIPPIQGFFSVFFPNLSGRWTIDQPEEDLGHLSIRQQ
jgi:hypothetical protein